MAHSIKTYPDYHGNEWVQIDDLEDGRFLVSFSDTGLDLLRHYMAGAIKDADVAERDFVAVWALVNDALEYAAWEQDVFSVVYRTLPPEV